MRPGTVGRLGPGARTKIFEATAGSGHSDGGMGEVCCRARNVFMGYHRDEAKTREAFTEDGWFRTGDLGSFDEDGFLRICGRLKEIIVTSGGKNIAPAPIQQEIKKELEEVSNSSNLTISSLS